MENTMTNKKDPEMITGHNKGWKILRDMGLLLIIMMGLLTDVDTRGTVTEKWMQLAGPVGAVLLLIVVWRHLRGLNSVGLRGCALLMLMTLTMQLQQEDLAGRLVPMGLSMLLCTAAGLLLGMGILMLMRRLPEKRWITMAGVGAVLLLLMADNAVIGIRFFSHRMSTGLVMVFLGVIVQGFIYSNGCSDAVRIRESLMAFVLFALFLTTNSASAEVILLALTMLVLAAVYLEDRRGLFCLAAVLAAMAFGLLLLTQMCWNLYQSHDGDVPRIVELFAKIMNRIRRVTQMYLNPAGADIMQEGYQPYRIREALQWADFTGKAWHFVQVPQAYSVCAFTTFVITFGVLPAGMALALLLGIFRRSATIAGAAKDRLEGAVGLAFGSFLMLSGILSAAGNVGLIPLMGYTFPILADSGTSLVLTVAMLACLARIPVDREEERWANMKSRSNLVWAVSGAVVVLILLQLLLLSQ